LVDNLREVYNNRTVNMMAAGSNYRYPDAIMVPELMEEFGEWLQSGGDDYALKQTIAKCVESSLLEILSLAGEDL
jgi:Fic family protein